MTDRWKKTGSMRLKITMKPKETYLTLKFISIGSKDCKVQRGIPTFVRLWYLSFGNSLSRALFFLILDPSSDICMNLRVILIPCSKYSSYAFSRKNGSGFMTTQKSRQVHAPKKRLIYYKDELCAFSRHFCLREDGFLNAGGMCVQKHAKYFWGVRQCWISSRVFQK